jgi:hypothetical protein
MSPLRCSKEAAAFLSVSDHTLRNWRVRGFGPAFVKLGRGKNSPVAYTDEALQEWVRKQTRMSTSDEPATTLAEE